MRATTSTAARSSSIVRVDGSQVGGVQSVGAVHENGAFQDITLSGNFDPANVHEVQVEFINDANDGQGGLEGHDRNLYVDSLTLDGKVFQGEAAANTADLGYGFIDPDTGVMVTNGTLTFDVASAMHAAGSDYLF